MSGSAFLAEGEQYPDRQRDEHQQPPVVTDLAQEPLDAAEHDREHDHGADDDHPEGQQTDGELRVPIHGDERRPAQQAVRAKTGPSNLPRRRLSPRPFG